MPRRPAAAAAATAAAMVAAAVAGTRAKSSTGRPGRKRRRARRAAWTCCGCGWRPPTGRATSRWAMRCLSGRERCTGGCATRAAFAWATFPTSTRRRTRCRWSGCGSPTGTCSTCSPSTPPSCAKATPHASCTAWLGRPSHSRRSASRPSTLTRPRTGCTAATRTATRAGQCRRCCTLRWKRCSSRSARSRPSWRRRCTSTAARSDRRRRLSVSGRTCRPRGSTSTSRAAGRWRRGRGETRSERPVPRDAPRLLPQSGHPPEAD
mmetsp:Transcript_32611/g.104374  ORF Transcript_32611/g.104374 Transcript_32611/m.104374 type:complete len:264 (-) Transcript_32611:252-1043(-)